MVNSKKKKTAKKLTPLAKAIQSAPTEEKENQFDFGGLPARDLKKNLGCG